MNQDADLVQQTLKGDNSAFAQLVERYKPMVFGLVLKIVGSYELAEELAQDAFVKAYTALSSYKAKGGAQFSTWLYRIAYNTAISEKRKKRLSMLQIEEQRFLAIEDSSSYDDEALQLMEKLAQLVEQLPPEDGALLKLFYWASKSINEVALITGHSVANVKVRLHRIRTKLATKLEKEGNGKK